MSNEEAKRLRDKHYARLLLALYIRQQQQYEPLILKRDIAPQSVHLSLHTRFCLACTFVVLWFQQSRAGRCIGWGITFLHHFGEARRSFKRRYKH